MKKSILLFILILLQLNAIGQSADVNLIINRLESRHANEKFNSQNVTLWQNTISSAGRWSDIDYTITTSTVKAYSPITHLQRTFEMVVAYTKNINGNLHFHNPSLLIAIKRALSDNLGRTHDAVFGWNNDWYATYIANPGVYGRTLFLLKNHIPQSELLTYSDHFRDGLTVKNKSGQMQFTNGGQNLVWVSNNSIYKGAIENNSAIINNAFYYIASTLSYMAKQGGEGIKKDFAFHQHGAQLYCAGYGLSYSGDIVINMDLSLGTSYHNHFTPEKKQLFNDLMLGGHRWFNYRNVLDYGSHGRGISRIGNYAASSVRPWLLTRMQTLDAANASLYLDWYNNNEGAENKLIGNKHFWQTDIMVHRGTNFYLSTKIPSIRTNGTETMNTENLKGFNLAVGAMNINTSGNEYKDIFPVWDWSRVPGTTAELNVTYPSAHIFAGTNTFAGGASSNGKGAIAFKSSYNGISNSKAYFYLGNSVLCMGAGINANRSNSVVTSLNQCLSNGAVSIFNGSLTSNFTGQTMLANTTWIHHDQIGYLFPQPTSVTVKNQTQTGTWFSINNLFSTDQTKAIQSKQVFSAWIDHGKAPVNQGYSYIVVPNVTADKMPLAAQQHGYRIVRNDTLVQAVENSVSGVKAIIFYQAGSITFPDGISIASNKAAVVLAETVGNNCIISVSDPNYNAENISLTINRKLSGTGSVISGNYSTITYALPSGEMSGSTQSRTYNVINTFPTVNIISPTSNTVVNAPATITIEANASDFDGAISKVEFYQGNTLLGVDASSPYSFVWSNVIAGQYSISAKAFDNQNASTTSSAVAVTVTDPIPETNWKNISLGKSFSTLHKVVYSVTPSAAFMNLVTGLSPHIADQYDSLACIVRFSTTGIVDVRDGSFYKANQKFSYTANTTYWIEITTNPLTHLYSVRICTPNSPWIELATQYQYRTSQLNATKISQLTGYESSSNGYQLSLMEIAAINISPTINLLSPLPTFTAVAPASINILANAADSDGSITKVEFYQGSILLNTDLTAPYSFTWNNVPGGIYSVYAKAYDNNGATTNSASVSIEVTAPAISNCTSMDLSSTKWVVRNNWSDQNNGLNLSNENQNLKVTHRAWGQNYYWLITSNAILLTAGKSYTFSFTVESNFGIKSIELGLGKSYQWDGPILAQSTSVSNGIYSTTLPNTKSITVIPASTGNFFVALKIVLTNQPPTVTYYKWSSINYCLTSNIRFANIETTLEEEELEVYPNPISDQFTIQLNGNFQYQLFDSKGLLVESGYGLNQLQITNPSITKGVYKLVVIQEGKHHTKTLIYN